MTKKTATVAASDVPSISASFPVPLSSLVLSEEGNVRSSATISQRGIEQMASMLESSGQLYPLIVSKAKGNKYTVHAGQRRFRGFKLLESQGRVAADHPVDVREIDASIGVDMSLVENLSQEPMHPADEFSAFQKLANKGASVEQIAAAYGCKVLQVKRRMKLANVHPQLLEMFRNGKIHLDQVVALAGCDDQQRQLQTWESLPTWGRSDQQIRRHLSDGDIRATDPRVTLVGLDVYLKAGGSVREDLFSEGDEAKYLTDAGLLEILLSEKVEAVAEPLRSQGWAWVDVLPSYGWEERQLYKPYPTVYLPETEAQTTRRQDLETQIEQLQAQVEVLQDKEEESEDDESKIEELEKQISSLDDLVEAIKAERVDLNGVDMLTAGVLVYVDEAEIVCQKPMIKAADMKAMQKTFVAPIGTAAAGGADAVVAEVISERLMKNLTAQRTGAIQASMVENQRVTLAALAAFMAQKEFCPSSWAEHPVKMSITKQWSTLRDASPTFETSRAHAILIKVRDEWVSKLPEESSALLQWFIEQPLSVSLDMITFCTSVTVNAMRGRVESKDVATDLAQALNLDMRDWWQPTRANYLDLVPKAKMIEAVREAQGGPAAAPDWEKLKKAEVIDRADDALQNLGWLPSPLR